MKQSQRTLKGTLGRSKTLFTNLVEHKWTYHYINKLSQFVETINSRVNRVTELAPNKVTKNTYLCYDLLLTKPRFEVRDTVRIAKQDLPFKKGYQQNFTDEIFTIRRIATLNPPTSNLTDADGEIFQGKIYEPELTKTNGRV